MIFTDIVTTTPSVVLAVSLGYRAVTRAPARPGAGGRPPCPLAWFRPSRAGGSPCSAWQTWINVGCARSSLLVC